MAERYGRYVINDETLAETAAAIKERENEALPIRPKDFPERIRALAMPGIDRGVEVHAVDENENWTELTVHRTVPASLFNGFTNKKLIEKVAITRAEKVGGYAFAGCSGITELNFLGNTLSIIDKEAFYGCSKVTELTLPEGLLTIGSKAFYGCSGMVSLTLPSTLTSIAANAFEGCKSLESLTVPESLTSIGLVSFGGCTGMTKLYWNPPAVSAAGTKTSPSFAYCTGVVEVVFGERVTVIPGCLCVGMTSLSKLNIQEGITNIGSDAFSGCKSLTSITIPESLKGIGYTAFEGCTGLTKLTWNAQAVSAAGSHSSPSFAGCTGVEEVVFGEKVTVIPENLCYGLTALPTVDLPEGLVTIGSRAFLGCVSLTSITLPESLKNLNFHAFYNCTGLAKVYWNAKAVAGMHSNSPTFAGCTGLTTVECGENVTSIPVNAFKNATNLAAFVIRNASAVMSLGGTSAFTGTAIASGTGYIYAPDALVEEYKAATNWAAFADQIKPLSEYVEG